MDEVVPEPLGGAHNNPAAMAKTLREYLLRHLEELSALPAAARLKRRYEKFRAHGHFLEKPPTPAEKEAVKKAAKRTPVKAHVTAPAA